MEGKYRRGLLLFFSVVLLCSVLASASFATTYYVDSVAGNDNYNGTSQSTPWQSLTKVSTVTFLPGDQILLKCGSVWNGQQLYPKGSGSSGSPIVIDSYSTGAKPLINGQGAFQQAVHLSNQQYWEINNLEITNWAATAGIYQGVHVLNTNAGTLNHVYLQNLDVHDVNGHMTEGLDKGKGNGGILVEVAGVATPSKWNDVLVQGCNVYDLSRTAIRFSSSWGSFCTNPTVVLSTNVVVRNCAVWDYAGDGICAFFADGALVEYNVSDGGCYTTVNANAAVWFWDNVNSVLQYNEVYNTAQTRDGMAFDLDGCCDANIVQYNYSHDNEGGFVMIISSPDCAAQGSNPVRLPFCKNNIVRYNISQRDETRVLRFVGKINDNRLYNNTIYIGGAAPKIVDSGACDVSTPVNTYLYNNIIYNTEVSDATYTLTGTNYVWDYNLFYGYHPASEPADTHKLTSDPLFVDPGNGGAGRDSADVYKLLSGSPAINSGLTISGNGGQDYFGNPLYNGAPDRGAHEYPSGPQPPVALFSGSPRIGYRTLAVSFTDQSVYSPTSWSWTFGDGGTSAAQHPTHSYSAAGLFTVSLTATNSAGSDTNTKSNYITVYDTAPPVADFVADVTTANAPVTILFTDLSTNGPTSWSWSFGDGGTSAVQNPGHTYTSAGQYTVSLTATNPYGSDAEVKTNYLTITSGAGGDYRCTTATIELGSLASGSYTDTYASDDVRMVVNAAKQSGKYWVNIAYTFETGLSSVTSLSVTEELRCSSVPTGGYHYRYVDLWNYSTGAWVQVERARVYTAGADVFMVTDVPSPGSYCSATGQVKVRTRVGQMSTTPWTYSVDLMKITTNVSGPAAPVADFTGNPTSGTAPLSVMFTDSSTNSPTSWSWTFGDGGTSTAQHPSHSYAAGTYTVSLTAANQYGSDDEVKTNYITVTSGGGGVPTFVAAGAVASGTGAITPALPAGLAANDILLLFLETANEAISITNQNGGTWAAVAGSPQGTGTAGASDATRLTVFWSRYNGTQGAPTAGDSGNHQAGRIIALRGCATSGDPWDVTAGGTESTVDTSGAIPGATTTVANTLVVAAIATSLPDTNGTANFSTWANGDLTSVTERIDNTRNAGNGGGLAVATGEKATAGAYGATAVTCGTAAAKGMMSIALKP